MAVYNVEQYIRKTIDSILNQTFKDFELICIDDGSTDKSGIICDEYASKDSRIRVFHKPNGGVATARQLALDNVTAQYFINIDPDDWVEPNMLQDMFLATQNGYYDLVYVNTYKDIDGKKSILEKEYNFENWHDCLTGLIDRRWHCYTVNKLIKTSFCKKNNISFPQILKVGEDSGFLAQLLLCKPTVKYLDSTYYHYCIRQNSLSNSNISNYIKNNINVYNYLKKIITGKKYDYHFSIRKIRTKINLLNFSNLKYHEYKTFLKISLKEIFDSNLKIGTKLLIILAESGFIRFAKDILHLRNLLYNIK